MPKLKALGHACFTLYSDQNAVIFDPWLSENPEAAIAPEDVKADAILASHGHSDHLGDAIDIATRLDIPIVGPYELCMYCERHGAKVEPMHIGGGRDFDFGYVKLTQAWHGSAVIEEDHIEYTGPACGFLVTIDERTIYYSGDTGLFGDMALIGEMNRLHAVLLPIGDNFTMGPDDALQAAQMLDAGMVVPMHYSAFEVIQQDPEAFAERLKAHDIKCVVLRPGEETQIP